MKAWATSFLAHIRETDAIAHVVRCFDNDDVVHVAGKLDPLNDIEIINTELALADLESVERAIVRTEKRLKANDKDARLRMTVLEKLQGCLDQGHRARNVDLNDDETRLIRDVHLITTKPVMYVANVAEDGFRDNPYLDVVREKAEAENARMVPVCAGIEAEIALLDESDRQEFLSEAGPQGIRPGAGDSCRLRIAEPVDFFYSGRKAGAGLDSEVQLNRAASRRPYSYGF